MDFLPKAYRTIHRDSSHQFFQDILVSHETDISHLLRRFFTPFCKAALREQIQIHLIMMKNPAAV